MEIVIYTDGSSLNNQCKGKRRGGIGIYFGIDDIRNQSIPLIESDTNKVTNQVAELTACIVAIENVIYDKVYMDTKYSILICTDSMYTVNCITKWCKNWEKNNWKKSNGIIIENLELIKTLYSYYKKYTIKFKHITAHKTEPPKSSPSYNDWYGNMMADMYATNASKNIISI